MLSRIVCGTIWALAPRRIGLLWPLTRLWLNDRLGGGRRLPLVDTAPRAGGFVGIARDLSVPTLVEAYRRGFFTCGHFGPLKWVSPERRCVLNFADLHIGKDVRRLMRQDRYRITFDRAFDQVIAACANRRTRFWHLTWITPHIMHAYAALHEAGYAHSYEAWNADGELVGGGYGVAIGGVFFGESQFYRERNASKVATVMLIWHLARWGFLLADAKTTATAMRDLGFREIMRDRFRDLLAHARGPALSSGPWAAEVRTSDIARWNPAAELAERSAQFQTLLDKPAGTEISENHNSAVPHGIIGNLKVTLRSPPAWITASLAFGDAILS